MQNKIIQPSNTKSKKEQSNKKELNIINSINNNNIELSKHKSHEVYNMHSSKSISNNINQTPSDNSNKNTTLSSANKQNVNFSGAKNQNKRKSYNVTLPQFKNMKKYNNIQNNNEKEKNICSEKIFIRTNDNKLDSDKNNENNKKIIKKEYNYKEGAFSEKNINKIKSIKKNALDNILSESDSFQEIDSMEEDNLSKGNRIKSSNAKINMNLNNINNLKLEEDNKNHNQLNTMNYKRHFTTDFENSNENKNKKVNKVIYNKKIKKEKNKKSKKSQINDHHKNKNEEIDEDIIVDDNEFDSSKNIQDSNLIITKFPKLSVNPFTADSNSLEKNSDNNNFNCFSNKDLVQVKKNQNKEINIEIRREKTMINKHIKTSTLETNNNFISSNLDNIMEELNHNKTNTKSNNLSKENPDIEKKYKNLILMAKKGDKEKFTEIFNQILSLPKNLININYKDENGNSALHYSCDEGNLKIVEILLNANCETNIKNNKKETPLHLASKRGYFDISKKLIANGALLNVYNSEKNSPLHIVCMHNYLELLKFFLTKLPQADEKNIYGKTPLDLTTNKEIKNLLENYLKKNENKYKKITIYQTSDSKMNNLLDQYPHEERDWKSSKDLNIFKNNLKNNKSYTSVSPSNKNPRSTIRNKKGFNSIPECFDNFIIKKNTLPKNFGLKSSNHINIENNNSSCNVTSSLNFQNMKNSKNNALNKANTNSVFKKNEIVNNAKLKGKEKDRENSLISNIKSKKDQNFNNLKDKEIFIQENNHNSNNFNTINISNYSINGLKKTKTIDKFSSLAYNNQNKTNLYNNINKGHITLNESKLNNSNIHDKANNSQNRIHISNNIKKDRRKLNNSVKKFNKEKNIINDNGNMLSQNKSKIFENTFKKNILLDSIEFSNGNLLNLNKTEESISDIPKISKISRSSLKKQNMTNNIKNVNNTKCLQTTEKILTKNKINKKRQNQTKKEKNNDNSIINNCNNISKISCSQNKNNMMLDSINKSNIIDQTLADMHNKLNLNSIEEERITPSSFVCLALLGKGSFGEVYLVQKINTKEKYAMKVLRKERIMGQNLLKYAIAERNVLSLSHHPFIVKLNFAFQTSTKLFLILEYCPNGDLGKHLLFEKRFSERKAKFYICEVLLALENLHQRDIIFRDLKPDNVVLDEEGHCKLTDFGLSKEGVNENQYAQSFCGSIAYLAPEMLKKQGHGKAVDWYLLGVLFYEMLVGITPYFTSRKEEIFHNIEFGELKIPNFVSPEAAELLRGLLERDPNKRLGGSIKDAQEIKEHPYFKDVDWDKVYNKKIKPPTFMNYMNKMIHVYHKPRLFANDDLFNKTTEKPNNMLSGWSFINNEEM